VSYSKDIKSSMPTSFLELPIATIEKALAIRKQIEALQLSVKQILGGASEVGNGKVVKRRGRPAKVASVESPASAAPAVKDGRKGKRSAATIAKMKAAQKARWAAKNGAAPAAVETPVVTTKKKRTMSPEARARIAAAQKARWAKFRKA
jgi:hypothetical protein